MLSKEDYAVIRSLNEHGVYLKDIAAELEVHPRTVKRALQRGGAPKPRDFGVERYAATPFNSSRTTRRSNSSNGCCCCFKYSRKASLISV